MASHELYEVGVNVRANIMATYVTLTLFGSVLYIPGVRLPLVWVHCLPRRTEKQCWCAPYNVFVRSMQSVHTTAYSINHMWTDESSLG